MNKRIVVMFLSVFPSELLRRFSDAIMPVTHDLTTLKALNLLCLSTERALLRTF